MKAILVGVSTKDDLYDIEYSLKELTPYPFTEENLWKAVL